MKRKKKKSPKISEQMQATAGELRPETSFVIPETSFVIEAKPEDSIPEPTTDDDVIFNAHGDMLAAQGLLTLLTAKCTHNDPEIFAVSRLVASAVDRLEGIMDT